MKRPLLKYEAADLSINSDQEIVEEYIYDKNYEVDDLETNINLSITYRPPTVDTILVERKHTVNSI